jgi:hypothetical protein
MPPAASFDQESEMGTTIAARALEGITFNAIATDSRWGPLLQQVREKLLRGDYGKLADVVFQNGRNSIATEDVFGFAQVWAHLHMGHIGVCTINLHELPGSDADVLGNQSKLNENIHPLFQAIVDPARGGLGGDDGTLSWDQPIELTRLFLNEESGECRSEAWLCEPQAISLEIGTTNISTTLMHLRGRMGVARWPYGSEEITVLVSHSTLHDHVHKRMY